MSSSTSIEWTEETWNPVRGCGVVSPGCTNCYAMKQAHRFSGKGKAYEGLTKMSKGGPVWTGKVALHRELLDWPLRRKKPLRIFVNSMSDLFHEDVSWEFIDAVFGVMAVTERHTYQILTKRPKRMLEYLRRQKLDPLLGFPERIAQRAAEFIGHGHDNCGPGWPLSNVWLGVSVEDQERADERIPLLLQTPAAVRWISAEPLLGPLNLRLFLTKKLLHPEQVPPLDWVVVGGESGPGARACSLDWIRSLMEQCRTAGVPIFVKQLGAHGTFAQRRLKNRKGGDPLEWPEDLRVREYPA